MSKAFFTQVSANLTTLLQRTIWYMSEANHFLRPYKTSVRCVWSLSFWPLVGFCSSLLLKSSFNFCHSAHFLSFFGNPNVRATGCPGRIVFFFHDPLQPVPRLLIAARDCRSNQSNESVCTVTPIGWPFFVQPIAAQCWRSRGRKIPIEIFWKKTHLFSEHPLCRPNISRWRKGEIFGRHNVGHMSGHMSDTYPFFGFSPPFTHYWLEDTTEESL